MSARWATVLDDLEARVRSAEAALDAGLPFDEDVNPFTPPADLERLPENQLSRAETLLVRQAEIEQRLRTSMEAVAREIGDATRQQSAGGRTNPFGEAPIPQYVDHKA